MIIGVDPGKMTGLALFDHDRPKRTDAFRSWQEPTWDAVATVERGIESGKVTIVVCEAFVITAQTLRKTRGGNWSLESIGALRYMCLKSGITFVDPLQKAADAMRFATDAKLKKAGFYVPGKGHANDAARHVMLYLANTKRLGLIL